MLHIKWQSDLNLVFNKLWLQKLKKMFIKVLWQDKVKWKRIFPILSIQLSNGTKLFSCLIFNPFMRRGLHLDSLYQSIPTTTTTTTTLTTTTKTIEKYSSIGTFYPRKHILRTASEPFFFLKKSLRRLWTWIKTIYFAIRMHAVSKNRVWSGPAPFAYRITGRIKTAHSKIPDQTTCHHWLI